VARGGGRGLIKDIELSRPTRLIIRRNVRNVPFIFSLSLLFS
jgi:hypothetical protein